MPKTQLKTAPLGTSGLKGVDQIGERTMSTIGFVGRGAIGVRLSNRSWSLPPTRVTVWRSLRTSGSTSPTGASSPPTMMVSDPVSARGTLLETGPSSS